MPDPAALLADLPGVAAEPPAVDCIATFRVDRGVLRQVAQRLKEGGFRLFLDLGGVDYPGRQPRFELVYHLLALPAGPRVRLLVGVPEEDPVAPTLSDVWRASNWAEREVYDLFGVHFEGHPGLKRILMPDDWEGHPLRKDYPLRGPRADREPAPPAAQPIAFFNF
ncbi:MAG: NADH-quinone oxidoreductase subunit C [Clostridia bacterium]|nr:NADH-quinone oxidoreductase subunit C [Clostridia bacterium]